MHRSPEGWSATGFREGLNAVLVRNAAPNADAEYWLVRRKYRKEFGLTAEQMDREPASEVQVMFEIFAAEHKRQKLDEKRDKQRGQSKKT